MKRVQILMSTYNGEQYLREQMDSILSQDCEDREIAHVKLLIRDDGSTDCTGQILKEYAERYEGRVEWYQGENKGVVGSFFDLLERSDEQADYWGFADQDDFWLPRKVSAGVNKLERESPSVPTLYCSSVTVADENLNELEIFRKNKSMRPGFGNALVENIAPGCTILMNASLRDIVLNTLPSFAVMHDWWLYLTASCFGNVIYDDNSYILYRQHQNNVIGSSVSRWQEFVGRVRRYRGNRGNISRQVGEFLKIYHGQGTDSSADRTAVAKRQNEVSEVESNMRLAEKLITGKKNVWTRLELVRSDRIYRQRKEDNRIFRIILLAGSY